MSTNFYYWQKDPCPCCLRGYDSVFIGKRAAGWKFMLHATWHGQTWEHVKESLRSAVRIEDENGLHYTAEEMIEIVEGWQAGRSHAEEYPGADSWHDPDGYVMSSGEWS